MHHVTNAGLLTSTVALLTNIPKYQIGFGNRYGMSGRCIESFFGTVHADNFQFPST